MALSLIFAIIEFSMEITPLEIEKLANLSRIKISDAEKATFAKEIGSILNYVNQIKEVVADTKRSTSPSDYPHRNVLREDVENRNVVKDPADVIASAPASHQGFVKVKKIIN